MGKRTLSILLLCLLVPAALFASDFMAGAAVRDITPTFDMLPLSRKPAVTMTGVLDPMHVRAIALSDGEDTVLIICTETGRSMGAQYAALVSSHTGLPLENIVMTSTHSHAVPEVTGDVNFYGSSNLEKWAKYTRDQMLDAVDEALDSLEPVTVGIGYGESYINVNRNSSYIVNGEEQLNLGYNGAGVSDKTVAAIEFRNLKGEPVAYIINYAVHNTVMHANTLIYGQTGISADIAGLVSSYLEANNKGAVAMWVSGAAGDQNPIVQNDIYTRDPVTGEFEEYFNNDYAILKYLAKIHYYDVEKTLGTITGYTSDIDLSASYAETVIPDDYPVALQVIRIGDIALACFPGELFSTIGLDIKASSLLKDTIVVNNCWSRYGQKNGYHADDAAIDAGGFGTNAAYKKGYLTDALIGILNDALVETGIWLDNGDGTATYSTTGEVTIIGVDGVAGTSDDNKVVNPAGKAIVDGVKVEFDADGKPYVSLGSLTLVPGADGKIGTVDDTVAFGRYQQSDHYADGVSPTAIDWYVLDVSDGKALLASEKILMPVKFNLSDSDGNDWAYSNLRAWLNSNGGVSASGDTEGFYDAAFNEEEKALIVPTEVKMNLGGSFDAYNRLKSSDWWELYTTAGTDTVDNVYALSAEEVWEYFGESTVATYAELGHDPEHYTNGMAAATAYAVAMGINVNSGGNGASYIGYADSWTRSNGAVDPTGETQCGVFLGSVGSLNSGRSVTRAYGARPCVTVTL